MNDYFCGLYFKCQSKKRTIAIIPAFHKSNGEKSCSLQLACDTGAFNISYSYSDFSKFEGSMRIDKSYFGMGGVHLDINTDGLCASGDVIFTDLSPLRYDIMGPFKYVPFMECRHSVFSMRHTANGSFFINGEKYDFFDGVGYIEGDRGHSFPREYAWTQCLFDDGSLMLSVADIPMGGIRFTGVICAILFKGKEYRLATYLGGRAVKIEDGEIVVKQGEYTFSANLIEKNSHPLAAPVSGKMARTIHESAACRAAYFFKKDGKTVFDFESDKASFEYEYRK